MLKKSVAIACFALPFMAMAENGPQWNSVGIAYAEQKPEGVGLDLCGLNHDEVPEYQKGNFILKMRPPTDHTP